MHTSVREMSLLRVRSTRYANVHRTDGLVFLELHVLQLLNAVNVVVEATRGHTTLDRGGILVLADEARVLPWMANKNYLDDKYY